MKAIVPMKGVEMALVSIIVPVYNVEKYLEQCINSLLNQTMKDIEVICVDDGSTDSSSRILNEFSSRDPRVQVISKENTGYGDSMNRGIARAKGKYIGIVESDDYVLPDMFSSLLREAERTDADVVKSNYHSFSESSGLNYEEILNGIPYHKILNPKDHERIWKIIPSIWSALYRKDFLEKNGIMFHATPGASYQDVSFGYKVLLSTEKMVCVPEAYLCYRSDNENSSVKSTKKVFCIMDEFGEIKKYIRQKRLESMMPIILREQFTHYTGNYYRIDSIYQYAFLQRMREEFVQDYESGYAEQSLWPERDWELLHQIMRNPEAYFESTNIDYLNKYKYKEYAINHCLPKIGAEKIIDSAERIIIYGAGMYGQKLLGKLSDKSKIIGFAVTSLKSDMPKEIQGIPVYGIQDLKEFHSEAVVLVAMKKVTQQPVLEVLKSYGFQSVISIDSI